MPNKAVKIGYLEELNGEYRCECGGLLTVKINLSDVECESLRVEGRSFPLKSVHVYQCDRCREVHVSNRKLKV